MSSINLVSQIALRWDRYIVWLSLASRRLYNIKYICTIYTRLYTCLMSISRFAFRDRVTLRLFKLLFLRSGCGRVV